MAADRDEADRDKPGESGISGFVDYSPRDHHIVDYALEYIAEAPGIGLRGPIPPPDAPFFSCIGSAQTLGVLVEQPYPALLETQIGLPAFNLGLGAIAPGAFLRMPKLLARASLGRFAIIQVMTARSEPNDRFERTSHIEMMRDRRTGEVLPPLAAWDRIARDEPDRLADYAAQSRANWIESYRRLRAALPIPALLFWFAPTAPGNGTIASGASAAALLGTFPQLVTADMLDHIRPLFEGFATCTSTRNQGHALIDRSTGQPTEIDYRKLVGLGFTTRETHNHTYPSPEMHADAAVALMPAIEALGYGRHRRFPPDT